jgi:hypothetical protein
MRRQKYHGKSCFTEIDTIQGGYENEVQKVDSSRI